MLGVNRVSMLCWRCEASRLQAFEWRHTADCILDCCGKGPLSSWKRLRIVQVPIVEVGLQVSEGVAARDPRKSWLVIENSIPLMLSRLHLISLRCQPKQRIVYTVAVSVSRCCAFGWHAFATWLSLPPVALARLHGIEAADILMPHY